MSALPADRTPDMLGEAMALADLGFRVIPIKQGSKHPPVQEWQRAATTDADMIRRWWTHLYRGHGIGIATGAGRIVLDIDVAGDKRGDDTLHELLERHGDLPDTVEAITGSGGRHIWLRVPCEVRNDAGRRLGHGIDVRGDGGQVLAPPTVHPNGTRYAWVAGHAPDEHPMGMAPAWLVELLRDEPAPAPTPRAPTTSAPTDDGPAARYNARTTWDQLLGDDGWTLHSERGEQRWVRPGKARRDGASATVGHDGRDVLKVFTSSVPWLPEGAYSRFGYYACRHHGGDRSAAARALRAEEQRMLPTQPQATIGVPATVPAADTAPAHDAAEGPTLKDRMRARLYRGGAMSNIPPRAPLIEGILDQGTLSVTYGPPKSAKSFTELDKACHIALGWPWLGHATTQGPTLYLLAEGIGGFNKRYRAWCSHHNVPDVDDLYLLTYPVRLLEDVELVVLLELIDELPVNPVYIVFDTLARVAVGAKENDASEMSRVINAADRIREHTGATVGFVHHSGKVLENGGRGSNAILGALDHEFQITKEGSTVTMKNTAQRDHDELDTQTFDLVPVGESVVVVHSGTAPSEQAAKAVAGPPTKTMEEISAYLEAAQIGVAQATLIRQINRRRQTILDALAHLEVEGYITKDVTTGRGGISYFYQHVTRYDGVIRIGELSDSHSFPTSGTSSRNQFAPDHRSGSPLGPSLGGTGSGTTFGNDFGEALEGEVVPGSDPPQSTPSTPPPTPTPSPQTVADHLADVIAEIG